MAQLEVRDLSPDFGAEIFGFTPEALDNEETRQQLQELFDTRELLLFRGIDLEHADQIRMSRLLIRKEDALAGVPFPEDTFYVSNKRADSAAPFGRLQFHSDTMWAEDPFEVLSLYGKVVEQPTSPTSFVSAIHAWKTLPDDLRKRVEGLEVMHTAGVVRRGDLTGVLVTEVQDPPTTVTKIGHVHPRTGATILYACEQMTKEVVGVSHEESEDILEQLFEHLYQPSHQWDLNWQEGDFAIWDNIAIQHARKNVSAEGPARTLRKAAIPMPNLRPTQRPAYSAAAML